MTTSSSSEKIAFLCQAHALSAGFPMISPVQGQFLREFISFLLATGSTVGKEKRKLLDLSTIYTHYLAFFFYLNVKSCLYKSKEIGVK